MPIDDQVREACSDLLLKCKKVLEAIERRATEEELLEAAKNSAASTFKLGNLVQEHVDARRGHASRLQEGFLVSYTQKLREVVVKYLSHSRRVFANPFDFLTKQELTNSLKEVVSITKQVIEAAKTLADAENEEDTLEDGSDITIVVEDSEDSTAQTKPDDDPANYSDSLVQMTPRSAGVAEIAARMLNVLNSFVQAIDDQNIQSLTESGRTLIGNLNELTTSLTELGRPPEGVTQMREYCAKLISTAKIAFTKPKDSVFRGQFENAKTELLKSIRTNVFEASARNKTLNRSLVRQSYENLRKNLGPVSLDQLRDSVDTSGSNTPTSTEVSPRADLPASPVTLPARSPLLRRVGQSQSNTASTSKEQYEQTKANVEQQRQQLMQQITARGGGDETIKPSNLSLKDKFENLQRQDDPSLKASPGALRSLVSSAGPKLISSPKGNDPKAVFANHIIDGLLDKFPHFKQEWTERNDADKQSVVLMIIRELAEYQIRLLQEKEITGRKASAGKPELPTSLKVVKSDSPKDKEKDKDKKKSAAAASGGTLKEKKAKKHRSIREKRKTNQGPDSFLDILDEDSATKSSEDKVTKELESIMSANTADWSQLTVKLKQSKVRGSVRRPGRKQDVRPMAPSEMTQTSSGLSSSVVDLIGALYEAAGASDEQFDAKMDLLSNHVLKVGDMMKKLIEGLQGSLTNVKEESALQSALNKTMDEMEAFPARGTVDQVDNELVGRGQYSSMIQQLLKEYVYDAGVSIQNMTQQILSDIELLNQYRQGNASSPITLDDTTEAVVLHVVALSITFKQRLAQALNDLETTRYLALERTVGSSEREGLGPRTLSKRESPRVRLAGGDHSVWTDEPESVNDGSLSPSSLSGPYRAGTINQLVRRLTPEDKSAENVSALLQFNQFQQLPEEESERVGFFKTFLLTYRSFMSAASLLDKLLERYHVPRGKLSPDESLVVKQRVCDVIKFWINEHSYDLDTMLFTKLKYFFDGAVKKDKLDHIAANILEDLGRMERLWANPAVIAKSPPREINAIANVTPFTLLEGFDENVIAKQLTQIEFDYYRRIRPVELQSQAWNKKSLMPLARNVLSLIQRANRVSFWVTTLILFHQKIKDRVRAVTKIIAIAKYLAEHRNYNTLMGFVAALNTSSISRLKHTFAAVPKRSLDVFKSLQLLMDPQGSFKSLREALKTGGKTSLPYLGTYLSDLTFTEDGNPDYVTRGEAQMINFEKWRLVYNSIQQIRYFQQASYNFPRIEPLYSLLYELPSLGEHELYQMSLEREPRGAERNQIFFSIEQSRARGNIVRGVSLAASNTMNATVCSTLLNCWSCLQQSCVWCMTTNACTALADCAFAPVKQDCCLTYEKKCDTCLKDSHCGFCHDTTGVQCQSGSLKGPSNGTCTNWFKSSCQGIDSPESFQTSFLIGLAIAIGCSFVILAIILLSIFIKRRIEQGKARKALKQYLRYGATDTGPEEGSSKRYLSYHGPINPALRASSSSPGGSGSYSANIP